ncbi:hypothetical protein SAMN05216338_1003304 [Bradyrhizobium sp. Rc2d]|nr:hypothetical protein SAMN05216338_1003304 [Bradyrhizobium sp. Rc2d]
MAPQKSMPRKMKASAMLIAVSSKPLRHGDSIDRVCQPF